MGKYLIRYIENLLFKVLRLLIFRCGRGTASLCRAFSIRLILGNHPLELADLFAEGFKLILLIV